MENKTCDHCFAEQENMERSRDTFGHDPAAEKKDYPSCAVVRVHSRQPIYRWLDVFSKHTAIVHKISLPAPLV